MNATAIDIRRLRAEECVHNRLPGGQAETKAAASIDHGMIQVAGVLPAHRLPAGNRDGRRCERIVVRGGHRDDRSAAGAQVAGRGVCGITSAGDRKSAKGEEREVGTHGQAPQVQVFLNRLTISPFPDGGRGKQSHAVSIGRPPHELRRDATGRATIRSAGRRR